MDNIKKNILLIVILFIYFGAFSQQEPQFTQNMFNNMSINPGYAGTNDAISVTALLRQQWVGFKDSEGNKISPETYLFSIDAPINILHGGLGATITQDKLGFEKNIGVKLGYAYRCSLGYGDLGIGLQVGFLNKSIDFSKFIKIDNDDPVLSGQSEESTMVTDFSFGLFYNIPGEYYFGISTSQFRQAKADIGESSEFYLKRHYYITAGYHYILPNNPSFEVSPSFLIKSDGNTLQYDISSLLTYNNKFWGGISYRVTDAIGILLGLNFKDISVGYSYDITTSKLGSVGSLGSHEIMLRYNFKIEVDKTPKTYKNTRYL